MIPNVHALKGGLTLSKKGFNLVRPKQDENVEVLHLFLNYILREFRTFETVFLLH